MGKYDCTFRKVDWRYNGAPVYQLATPSGNEIGWVARPSSTSKFWINSACDRTYYDSPATAARCLAEHFLKRLQRIQKIEDFFADVPERLIASMNRRLWNIEYGQVTLRGECKDG